MNIFDLRRANLNLLVVFEVLMIERHVGRAGKRLGLTQSAVSHALVRLRDTMNDPLFVRNPKGVEPTPRAVELAPRISEILENARAVLSPTAEFDVTRPHQFVIGATDGAVNAVLIPLMHRLRLLAPAVTVKVMPTSHDGILGAIDRMEIDVAISVLSASFARVLHMPVMTMDYVGIARAGHPQVDGGAMSIAAFANLPHLVISAQIEASTSIDQQLAELGHKRRIAMVQPHVLAAPNIVACTDMVAIVDRNLAKMFASSHQLVMFDPPIRPPTTTIDLLISKARANEPPLKWFANQAILAHSTEALQP